MYETIKPFSIEDAVKYYNRELDVTVRMLKNATVASQKVELMVEEQDWPINGGVGEFCLMPGSSEYDGIFEDEERKEYLVSIKTAGLGAIKFQMSAYVGSGRGCTKKDLLYSLNAVDYFIIARIMYPNIGEATFWLIPSKKLIQEVNSGNLTPNGWSFKKFLQWLNENIERELIAA